MKTQSRHRWRYFRAGFTLIELLVVIVIIAVLAVLSISVVGRMKLAAAKVTDTNQMRNIGAASMVWASDNNTTEPFYFQNGTGTYPWEGGGGGGKYTPANPGTALYNKSNPASGYLQDIPTFFSPLVKSAAPSIKDYEPSKAGGTLFWGTYFWRYPFVPLSRRTGREESMIGHDPGQDTDDNPRLDRKLVMTNVYSDANGVSAKFGKQIYHALMVDGSVSYIADNSAAFDKWLKGK